MYKNTNYVKGRRYEYKILNEHKRRGFDICQRTAGSRSPVDIFCISFKDRVIKFIQCKPKSMSDAAIQRLEEKESRFNGMFDCLFRVL